MPPPAGEQRRWSPFDLSRTVAPTRRRRTDREERVARRVCMLAEMRV